MPQSKTYLAKADDSLIQKTRYINNSSLILYFLLTVGLKNKGIDWQRPIKLTVQFSLRSNTVNFITSNGKFFDNLLGLFVKPRRPLGI
jgi:hypothetical protein